MQLLLPILVAASFCAGCASISTPPPLAPAPLPTSTASTKSPPSHGEIVRKHRQLAQAYYRAGDLAAAASEWQILSLIAPEEDTYRHELASTRAAIRSQVKAELEIGNNAVKSGDIDRATQAMLKVLSLDADNEEAAKVLRDVDRQKLSRIQLDRAARVRQDDMLAANRGPRASPPAEALGTYDLEQRLELFKAGDVTGGLRELKVFVDANPNDRPARARVGAAVFDRAREIDSKGAREQALFLYEQAAALRGESPPEWKERIKNSRRALSDEYYENGVHAYRTDVAVAIKQWEASLRYDPQNVKAATRLNEARFAQEKLKRIEHETTPR